MEEGSLRCDVNVSLRQSGEDDLGVKTEIKNLNSFKAIEHALDFEIRRQEMMLGGGDAVEHATLLWDADSHTCRVMRSKEEAYDYRYFPEPDIPALEVSDAMIQDVRNQIPELPAAAANRFVTDYGIPRYDAELLTMTRETADYFERVARQCGDAKAASNWVMREVLGALNDRGIEINEFAVTAGRLARLIRMVLSGVVSMTTAKDVFKTMAVTGDDPESIVAEKGLAQIDDDAALDALINAVLDAHPDVVADCLAGNDKLHRWLVGQAMKVSRGRANPKRTADRLKTLLDERRTGG
jgi:aspartyl-tRNA(Asn)/glutamyl-tRNA(Gln) amidotransferase subunit B